MAQMEVEEDGKWDFFLKLEGQLTLAPITDGQLADAFGILGQAGEEGQDKEEKEDRNPAGAEDPDTGSQKEPEGEGAYGSNKGEKTGKTGPEGEKKISQERESQPEKGSENQSAEELILENQNPENTGTEEAGSEKQNAENRSPEDPGAGNPDAEDPGSEKQSAENQSPGDPDAKETGSKDQNPESLPEKQEALEEAENDFKGSGEKPGSSKESGQEFGQGEKNTVPENLEENLAEDPAESSGKERAEAGNVTYVYSFNSDGGKAALYRKSDLLTKKEEELMDEQEKLQLIQSAGIMTQGDVRPEKAQDQGLDQGILLIVASVGGGHWTYPASDPKKKEILKVSHQTERSAGDETKGKEGLVFPSRDEGYEKNCRHFPGSGRALPGRSRDIPGSRRQLAGDDRRLRQVLGLCGSLRSPGLLTEGGN